MTNDQASGSPARVTGVILPTVALVTFAVEVIAIAIFHRLETGEPGWFSVITEASLAVGLLTTSFYVLAWRPAHRRWLLERQAATQLSDALQQSETRVNELAGQLAEATGQLQQEIEERALADQALLQANEWLKTSVAQLEHRNRLAEQLTKLGDLLQACTSSGEAFRAIHHIFPSLFSDASGLLYAFGRNSDEPEAIIKWGRQEFDVAGESFEPLQCWALKRGRPYEPDGMCQGLPCRKLLSHDGKSLCLPLSAQGETMGVLHLALDDPEQATVDSRRAMEELANTAAEHTALALANLRLRETLRNQAIRDPLTNLFNRRFMEETLNREIRRAERSQQSLGVIILDVDHFKQINDLHGHEAGDAVLKDLGAFLTNNIRSSDVACRFGGEEFVIILPEACLVDVHRRAEELRFGVRALSVKSRHQIIDGLSASLGMSVYPDHGRQWEVLLAAADKALYTAKQNGRDQVQVAELPASAALAGHSIAAI